MDFKKIKEELKSILYGFDKQEEVQQEAPVKKVYQDSELNISEKQVGGKVELIQEDGSLAAIPDGEYELESGDKFDVKDGFIVKWNDETEAPAQPQEEMSTEDTPVDEPKQEDWKAEVVALKAETEALKQMIEELKASIGAKSAQEQAMSEQFSNQLNELNESIKVLSTMPAEFSRTSTSNIVKDSNNLKTESFKSFFGLG